MEVCSHEDAITARYEIEVWKLRYQWFELRVGKESFTVPQSDLRCQVEYGRLILYMVAGHCSEAYQVLEYAEFGQAMHLLLAMPFKQRCYALLQGLIARQPLLSESAILQYSRRLDGVVLMSRTEAQYSYALIRTPSGLKSVIYGVNDARRLLAKALKWYSWALNKYNRVSGLTIITSSRVAERLAPLTAFVKLVYGELRLEALSTDSTIKLADGFQLELPVEKLVRRLDHPKLEPDLESYFKSLETVFPELEARPIRTSLELRLNGIRLGWLRLHKTRPSLRISNKQTLVGKTAITEYLSEIYPLRSTGVRASKLYNVSAESWLEAVVRRQMHRIDPEIVKQYVYRQIPLPKGRYRNFFDLMGVRRDGRLVVMEVKVAEDEVFPLQALDYWSKVETLRRQGYFDGLFGDLKLVDSPALVYLIAPALRFHTNFETISRLIDSSVPLFRIGINSNWRSGLRLYFFERAN